MQKLRSIGVLALVALFATCIWWTLGGDDADAPGAPRLTDAATAEGTAWPVAAEGAANAATNEAGSSRVAVEAGASRSERADSDTALVGRVIDEAGMPLADALVLATPTQSFDPSEFDGSDFEAYDPGKQLERLRALLQLRVEVATDADGRFRLKPRGKSRRVDLRVLARGFVLLQKSPQRPTEADVDVGTLTLKAGAIVSGRVVDPNGKGIANATVDRRSKNDSQGWGDFEYFGYQQIDGQRPGEECATDKGGHFELEYAPPGEFWLRARHQEHPIARLDGLVVAAGKTLTDLLVIAEAGASIRGRVIDLPKERQNLRVLASSRQPGQQSEDPFQRGSEQYGPGGATYGERAVEVAADGSFTLRGLHQDRAYRVWAVQSNGGVGNSSPCSQLAEVAAGAQGLELRYEAGVEVVCKVVDSVTGAPIELLWVREQLRGGDRGGMYWGDPDAARSKKYPDGLVTIGNLRPKPKQTLTLTIDAIGYTRLSRDKIAMPLRGILDLGILRLEPMPAIDVEVVAAAGGAPIAGASVSLREYREGDQGQYGDGQSGPRAAKTDAAGRCRLSGLPGKKVVIAVNDEDHARFASDPIALPEKGDYAFKAALLRGGSADVMVVAANGDPVANANVDHRDPSGRYDGRSTDASGKVTFDRQVPGQHRFRLSRRDDPGNLALRSPQRLNSQKQDPGWTEVEVTDGGSAQLTLSKQPTASVSGIVRQNGLPLANARVAFFSGAEDTQMSPEMQYEMMRQSESSGSGRTDEQGRYVLKEVAPGEHRLRVTHRDRAMSSSVPASLRIGDNSRDIDLEATFLRGTVRNPDGKPVAGASIRVALAGNGAANNGMPGWNDGQGNNTRTGADGRFELRGVQSGVALAVRAQAKGFAPATSAPVEVAAGGSRDDVDVTLQAAGSIHVTRALESGFAFVSAECDAGPGKGNSAGWEQIGPKGATLEGLAPGRWKVRVHTGEQEVEPKFVDVAAGQTVELKL